MSYNGWKNYETWNAALWIDNEEGTYRYWGERATEIAAEADSKEDATNDLAEEMQAFHEEHMPELAGMYLDLMQTALGEVDWQEVAASRFDDDQKFGDDEEAEGEAA